MSVNAGQFLLDGKTTLTFKSAGGTPSLSVTGDDRISRGSITITINDEVYQYIQSASGTTIGRPKTSSPEVYGTLTVTGHVTAVDWTNTSEATLHHLAEGLRANDPTKIPGSPSWATTHSYLLSGGCDFFVDLDLSHTYCVSGSDTTKTISLGAVSLAGGWAVPIGEATTEVNLTFNLIEVVDWTSWA